ncbi:PAS domain S-box protein [Acaryochloris sp. IP29b_bin.137]|uniref:hybrid sensor histidine kinase/response regulator n=1 Tax=Acaryochloris sp. IP29b_bin.137 TaxID=2969217 RepID=UPI002618A55A|nr:PAS domain S-box protein [Acaryochloris sp. IP29b_bin.137]
MLGTYQEITARVQAQQELQQLNEELEAKVEERTKALNMTQAAVNFAADTVFLIRPDGQFHYVNDTACAQLGYSREELLTMSVYDLDTNLTADDWPQIWEKVKLKSTMTLEAMMQPKTGNAYPVEFNTRYLEMDGEAYNVAFVRDITERKLADATIRRQNTFRKKILENMAEGLFVCHQISDAPFIHFTVWNQQMQALTGYTLAEINQLGFGLHPNPDDQVRAMTRLKQMHQGINIIGEEWDIQRKDGNRRTIALAASVLFDSDGQSSLLALVQDITERKQAEVELQRTNEELVRATHLKDEFLANMSHELRTPLNAILGMTEGLQDNVFGQLHFRQLQPLKIIESSATHLLELINDILDVATIESGQITLELSPASISIICQSSLAFIKQQAYKKCLQIEVKIPPDLPTVSLDERRVRQVLINLLSNAVKFTPPGGKITLEVDLRRQYRNSHPPAVEGNKQEALLQSLSRPTLQEIDSLGLDDCLGEKDHLIIAVRDTGIGIAPEHMQFLFQPFVQVDSSLNRKYEGTGLGLSLVKRIVELHGGYVDVVSEVAMGSCFTVTLPCVVEISSLDQQTTLNSVDSGDRWISQTKSPLILLAEDNEANSITISSYLQSKGYRIKVATNGYQALELAQSEPPDLILMDIQMPEMDGLATMQLIRKDSRLADVPIIALTAFTMEGDRERCCEAGANEYISKPVQPKKLVNAIQSLLDFVDHSAPSFP